MTAGPPHAAAGKGSNAVRIRVPLALLSLLLLSTTALAADLRITDSSGTEVVVTAAVVDYGSMLTVDKDSEGIRVLQGDGVVRLKWTDVEIIAVTRTDEQARPPRTELEIVMRNGTKVPATLFRKGAMTLTGRTNLGEYSIVLDKVRRIVPVR